MQYSNLHTHTIFSDGVNTPEENVLAAIENKMVSIGFSDHSYTEHDLTYCMRPVIMPAYLREIKRLAEKYSESIEVYLGLELDGQSKIENRAEYDYIIGDCHYVKTKDGYKSIDHCREGQLMALNEYFGGDATAYSKEYFKAYIEMTMVNRPDILGHFDLTTKFGFVDETDPEYIDAAKEAIIACMEVTPIVELNTGAIARGHRKVPYPAAFLLKEILAHKGKMILASDSHSVNNLTYYFDESIELLKTVGFDSITVLRHGKFVEVGI